MHYSGYSVIMKASFSKLIIFKYMYDVNLLAVLVAAVVAFVIGFLFHGPVFGKLWMKLAKITPTGNEKFSDMYGQMFMNLVANLITAYVIAVLVNLANGSTYLIDKSLACVGMTVATLGWMGFTIIATSMDPIWMKTSWKLWAFEAISSLACVLAMGAIVGSW